MAAPRLGLGDYPTPVERLDLASVVPGFAGEAWVKREDLTSSDAGGNKLRKLEYLFADATERGCDLVLTMGGIGSNHCLATAFWAPEASLDCEVVLFVHEVTEATRRTLRAICALGPDITVAPGDKTLPAVAAGRLAWLRASGRRPYLIVPGGSTVTGTLGWVDAGLELGAQVEAGELGRPDAVFCAYSSGGTAAGLAVGLQLAGLDTEVVAVRVYPAPLCSQPAVRTLARRTHARVRELTGEDIAPFDPGRLLAPGDHLGDGYAVPSEAGRKASALALELGLELEPTYTAKAFAAFCDAAGAERRGQNLVFVQTYDATLGRRLGSEPPRPELVPAELSDYV